MSNNKRRLILNIPHNSTKIPDMSSYELDFIKLFKEMDILTDRYTDELFKSDDDITIRAEFSRIFCDVERFEDEKKEVMAKYGRGALYTHTDDGQLMRKMTPELKEKMLTDYYRPHHAILINAIKAQVETYGEARIVDCHSFGSIPLNSDLIKDKDRPDICVGVDPYHTPTIWIKAALGFFQTKGFSVKVNDPYSGTIVPLKYLNKDKRVFSIMIEVNRKLYMNEETLKRNKRFESIKDMIHSFLYVIRNLPLDDTNIKREYGMDDIRNLISTDIATLFMANAAKLIIHRKRLRMLYEAAVNIMEEENIYLKK